jgi:hypothetical protein
VIPPSEPPPAWGPRYQTVPGPDGLKRIARLDGKPLCAVPPPRRRKRARADEPLTLRGDVDRLYNTLWSPLPRLTARAAAQQKKAALRAELLGRPDIPDGPYLRQLRESLEWSQRDLAEYSGVVRGVICACESVLPKLRLRYIEARYTLRRVLLQNGATSE